MRLFICEDILGLAFQQCIALSSFYQAVKLRTSLITRIIIKFIQQYASKVIAKLEQEDYIKLARLSALFYLQG